MKVKKIKEVMLSCSLCLLFACVFHLNAFAQQINRSSATDGQYIYHVEGNKICRYDMQGANRTEIYEGLPYGIQIEGLYSNYLYFNEFIETVEDIEAECRLNILNINNNTVKTITDMQSTVHRKGNKLYISYAVQGDYYFQPLYCADIDGNNYKLITETSNLNCNVINDKLYYIELAVLNGSYKHRVIKSDMDGSNPELVIDWFDSDSARLDKKGVVWNKYTGGSKDYFIKDYETKQDSPLNDNLQYLSFSFVDNQDYLYVQTSNYKTKKRVTDSLR